MSHFILRGKCVNKFLFIMAKNNYLAKSCWLTCTYRFLNLYHSYCGKIKVPGTSCTITEIFYDNLEMLYIERQTSWCMYLFINVKFTLLSPKWIRQAKYGSQKYVLKTRTTCHRSNKNSQFLISWTAALHLFHSM